MSPSESQLQRIEETIREIHEYARHTMQLYIAFFTFFVAMNYATMGFLVKDAGSKPEATNLIFLIARVFIYQNLLAVASSIVVAIYFIRADRRLYRYQAAFEDTGSMSPLLRQSALPKQFYLWGLLLCLLTYIGMIFAWSRYPNIWSSK
jgi:hypothetical protein